MRIKIQTHSGQADWNADVDDVDEVIISIRHPTLDDTTTFDVRFIGPKQDNPA